MSGSEVADVVNEALDACGWPTPIGDPEEGSRAADVARRQWPQCLRQLLRAAHWAFARKMGQLLMLGDQSGQTPGVGNTVINPWLYEYAYPTDCMKARFLPWNYTNPNGAPAGNIALPSTPTTTGGGSTALYGFLSRLIPAPFLISLDTNYPVDPNSNWLEVQGESPSGRVVILSNVNQAQLVYTAFMPYPNMWDSQFRAAMVAFLAARMALPLWTKEKNPKLGMEMRDRNMAIALKAVLDARATSANEANFPSTTDHTPDFLRIRNSGPSWGHGGAGPLGGGIWGVGGMGWGGGGFSFYNFDCSVF